MNDFMTEEQQVERIRAWWREYGLAIIGGIVIAIIIVVGMRYYRSYETRNADAASQLYTVLINSSQANDDAMLRTTAKQITSEYPSSPYAALAALTEAKMYAQQGKYKSTLAHLQWALLHSDMVSVRQVTRLRIARVYLQMKQPDKALQVLQTVNSQAYIGVIDQVRGDAYLQKKDFAKARHYYKRAMANIQNVTTVDPTLELKLADLPVSQS